MVIGRYDLSMPELGCEGCDATWTCGVHDLNLNDYWPATLHFSTVYATDVFYTFEELKMAAPGLSCQAFLKMLDQRTIRFGRVSTLVYILWKGSHTPSLRVTVLNCLMSLVQHN